jgi:hypothetical protein
MTRAENVNGAEGRRIFFRTVRGRPHERVENFWRLLKRCFKGTHVSVEPFHLFRYLDEGAFRFNNHTDGDGERFAKAVGGIEGRPLTYRQLIGEAPERIWKQRQYRGKKRRLR